MTASGVVKSTTVSAPALTASATLPSLPILATKVRSGAALIASHVALPMRPLAPSTATLRDIYATAAEKSRVPSKGPMTARAGATSSSSLATALTSSRVTASIRDKMSSICIISP